MAPSQVSAQDIESVRAAVVLAIVGIVLFWRIILQMMIAVIAVAAVLGLFMLLHSLH